MSAKFKIGDKVRFLNEKGEGEVLEILKGGRALVLLSDGIEIPYPLNELVPAEQGALSKKEGKAVVHTVKHTIDKKKKSKTPAGSRTSNNLLEMEVDLHIEELADHTRGMNNSQILEVQLSHARRMLEKAIAKKLLKVVFIHGVGTGKLKYELGKMLDDYTGLRYHDASYRKYGWGATEVLLH